MKAKYFHTNYIVIAATVMVVVLFFILPIHLPYVVKMPGKIVSAKEWILEKGIDGRLMTTLIDNKKGVSENYNISQFDRGDIVHFELNNKIESGSSISANDTIAHIYSRDLEENLISLKGELEETKASLNVVTSSEKQSVVEEAKQQITFAERELEEKERILLRRKKLYEKELISIEDYEISKSIVELSKIKVQIAKEKLATVESGSKREQVNLIKTQIKSLENQINILLSKVHDFTILSPLSGIVNRIFSGDTILYVSDTTQFVVFIPLEWKDKKYVYNGCRVKLDVNGLDNDMKGSILKVDKNIHALQGKQIVFAIAAVELNNDNLVSGLVSDCTIYCGDISPTEYVSRFISGLIN